MLRAVESTSSAPSRLRRSIARSKSLAHDVTTYPSMGRRSGSSSDSSRTGACVPRSNCDACECSASFRHRHSSSVSTNVRHELCRTATGHMIGVQVMSPRCHHHITWLHDRKQTRRRAVRQSEAHGGGNGHAENAQRSALSLPACSSETRFGPCRRGRLTIGDGYGDDRHAPTHLVHDEVPTRQRFVIGVRHHHDGATCGQVQRWRRSQASVPCPSALRRSRRWTPRHRAEVG